MGFRWRQAWILAAALGVAGVMRADEGAKEPTPTPDAQAATQAALLAAGLSPSAAAALNATPTPPPPPAEGQQPNADPTPALVERGADEPPPVEPPATPRAAAGSSIGEFQSDIDEEARMLRIYEQGRPDRQQLQVVVGEEFVTDVGFDNKTQIPFDEVRVLISYDAATFEPLSIDDSGIADQLSAEPIAEVDDLHGQLLYEARLRGGFVLDRKPILAIRWRAKRVVMESKLEFSSRAEFFTALNNAGKDILGSPRQAGDGTLNMTVTVLPKDPREAQALLTDPSVFRRTTDKIGGVTLSLIPQEEPIVVGKPFYIDVVLDNRSFSMLDGLSCLISYDNSLIEVVDADYNNLITRERNIHDGPFRTEFPWDMHIDNVVYQTLGMIKYRVATTDSEMTRGRVGPVARIYAVALRPTEGTPFVFKFSRQPRTVATSGVYVGEDTLGDPKNPLDGARGVVVRVQAAPVAEVAAGAASSEQP